LDVVIADDLDALAAARNRTGVTSRWSALPRPPVPTACVDPSGASAATSRPASAGAGSTNLDEAGDLFGLDLEGVEAWITAKAPEKRS
jgi:hypothetical protein